MTGLKHHLHVKARGGGNGLCSVDAKEEGHGRDRRFWRLALQKMRAHVYDLTWAAEKK